MNIRERIAKINEECKGVWSQSDVSDWERQRLLEWADRESLSAKQEAILVCIEEKVFDESDD